MTSAFRTISQSDPRFDRDGLRHVTVKSPALGQRADLMIHVPDAAASASGTGLPLVILLHGVYGSHWSWALQGGAHLTAAAMAVSGEIPPMVLAMPSDGLWGDGSAYRRHGGQDFERWIVEEVPRAVQEVLPGVEADSPRFLAGLSMGGFGALRLGARHGARFRGISAHSSITELAQFADFVEEPLDRYRNDERDDDGSVLGAMVSHRLQIPPFRFDCGVDDELLEANRRLHRELQAEGIPHHYEEFPGAHEWSYWEAHLRDSLRFFAALL